MIPSLDKVLRETRHPNFVFCSPHVHFGTWAHTNAHIHTLKQNKVEKTNYSARYWFRDSFSDLHKAQFVLPICQAWLPLLPGTKWPREIAKQWVIALNNLLTVTHTSVKSYSPPNLIVLGYNVRIQTGPRIKTVRSCQDSWHGPTGGLLYLISSTLINAKNTYSKEIPAMAQNN